MRKTKPATSNQSPADNTFAAESILINGDESACWPNAEEGPPTRIGH